MLLPLVKPKFRLPANPMSKRLLSGELTVLTDKRNLHASVPLIPRTNRPVGRRFVSNAVGLTDGSSIEIAYPVRHLRQNPRSDRLLTSQSF